ncbi:MAG: HDIG domain-containing protein [Terrisporobacter othiniensis]|uniref:HD domain-containing protein n=1 Tax=Terrisporobacter petrolearius TaxID=1460447 RepID=UPI001D16236F|nr:HD domain-containing protein [Terrisporobacter petrolearius]MCC3864476.1 HDIG domain-containing protein [Terrisporobacter petrolearius]MDU4859427.1 HDIG domain-containing protein [Terrisporobacter othiniensis]MDU6993814.1 HDIG domain-containing protein [Terrisporobacter othiniensis]
MTKNINIQEELEEVLLTYEKPSIYFISLKEDNNLDIKFPEIGELVGVIQSPVHHPEGDVFNHTMMVVDEAAKLKNKAKNPIEFMYSALCHDFGKVITTTTKEDGKIISYNHERAGLKLVRKFLNRTIRKEDNEFKDYVLNMVELHMQPNQLANQNSRLKSTRKLFNKSVCPQDLILLAKADALGRSVNEDYSLKEAYLKNALKDFQELE